MRIAQSRWTGSAWIDDGAVLVDADLVLAFGTRAVLTAAVVEDLRGRHPSARVLGCSTAGEIAGTRVHEGQVVTTAVKFTTTRVEAAREHIATRADSQRTGARLAAALAKDDLVHVFVLSDGLLVNGSELTRGLAEGLPRGVAVTGGLSGDGARFETTEVFLDGAPTSHEVVALGFYGKELRVGYGSLGGWDPFGPDRLVTRSEGSVVYELDGRPALDLYREYLGEHAAGLPASGLLFPLSIRNEHAGLVRTILDVDLEARSLTFAGDVPQGAYARLMRANFDRLIDGATGAAKDGALALAGARTELAILISCVGRKLVLKQRVEEELESVRDVLGEGAVLTGFYSYGELCPGATGACADLHNQTMTVTTLSEGTCTSSSPAS